MPCIAFVGLGRMGTPMCAALAKAGYEVTATDNRAERKPAALACGARWRETPAQAAATASVLISMLPGPREVHAAMLGEGGALTSLAVCVPIRPAQAGTVTCLSPRPASGRGGLMACRPPGAGDGV